MYYFLDTEEDDPASLFKNIEIITQIENNYQVQDSFGQKNFVSQCENNF